MKIKLGLCQQHFKMLPTVLHPFGFRQFVTCRQDRSETVSTGCGGSELHRNFTDFWSFEIFSEEFKTGSPG